MIDRTHSDALLAEAKRYAKRSMWWSALSIICAALAIVLALATSALADPKDGNPWVTIRHCEAQVDAENRNNQTLGYLIRIGEGVGDGRIVEEGTLRPGEKLRRIYRGEFFVRIRLGLNSDHYYSSHEGSTHCTGTPPPSPTPTPTPSPSPSPNPSPSPSVTPTPSPSASPTPPSPSPSVPSPTATPPPSDIPTASVSPPGQPCTPPCTHGGTPNTGTEFTAWFIAIAGLSLIGYGLWRGSKDAHV